MYRLRVSEGVSSVLGFCSGESWFREVRPLDFRFG